jgi:hypothetical protein
MMKANIPKGFRQMRLCAGVLAGVLLPNILLAQPSILWENSYGGTGIDNATCIIQSQDGGYAFAGTTASTDGDVHMLHGLSGAQDVWVVKLDAGGAMEWSQTYGGSEDDGANAIIQTFDGGYAVAGWTKSDDGDVTGNHGKSDYWILKLSSTGAIEWQQTYGGSQDETAYGILQTADSGFVVMGSTASNDGDVTSNYGGTDCWVVRISKTGVLVSQHSYGGSNNDYCLSIVQTLDKGYAMTGVTQSADNVKLAHGGPDLWVIKLDSDGMLQWQNAYGGSDEDEGSSIIQTPDSGYVVAGYTSSSDGDITKLQGGWDVWVMRLDPRGVLQWQKTYGGSQYDEAWSIVRNAVGGFALAGMTTSSDGDATGHRGANDYWILQLAEDGTLQWEECLGGKATDEPSSIIQTTDQGFAIAGFSNSTDGDVTGYHGSNDAWVVKLAGFPCKAIHTSIPKMTLQAKAGQVVSIPIISQDTSSRKVSYLDFTVQLNTDLLSPIGIDPIVGIFAGATLISQTVFADSIRLRFQLPSPTLIYPDTLCIMRCDALISDSLSSSIALTQIGFEDSSKSSDCLSALNANAPDSASSFVVIPECGNTVLSNMLENKPGLILESVSPNPAHSAITLKLRVPSGYQNIAHLEVYDCLGAVIQSFPLRLQPHAPLQNIPLELLCGAGVRYLRLVDENTVSTSRVLIER